MKTNTRYGLLKLSTERVREIQLAWDFVESSAAMPRFLNFPCRDVPVKAARRSARANEKRPLAA